jgi:Transposase DDE domain group 1
MTRLSCHRFRSNEVRLWLSLIACNFGNLWRRLVLPKKIENWSLTSLQQRLVKTGGRLIKHARYYWLMLAESHLTGGCSGAWSGASGRWRWRPRSGRAMIQPNRADQDVKAGEVFVKGIEKTGVRDFGFCERLRDEERGSGRPKDGALAYTE